MLTARHNAIIRCAKSRHTPTCSISVSTAEVLEFEVFDVKVTRCLTQSWIACTRPWPCHSWPNSRIAKRTNRSDWQYRLG
jgi:hypothetical protein